MNWPVQITGTRVNIECTAFLVLRLNDAKLATDTRNLNYITVSLKIQKIFAAKKIHIMKK